jgi:flagellar hook-length control protein FliK
MEDLTMVNSKDILARLQNGETAEDIANELVSALNDAAKTYNEEVAAKKAAEEEAKAKEAAAEAKKAKKLSDLQDILDLMHDFCIEYYCDTDEDINTVEAAFADLDAKSVNKMIEEAGACAVRFAKMEKYFDDMFGTPTVKKCAAAPKTRTADSVISDFLSSMGLK